MPGMNPEPMKSYSIGSRILCGQCGTNPEITGAEGTDSIKVTASCHGQEETKVFSRTQLSTVQFMFDNED